MGRLTAPVRLAAPVRVVLRLTAPVRVVGRLAAPVRRGLRAVSVPLRGRVLDRLRVRVPGDRLLSASGTRLLSASGAGLRLSGLRRAVPRLRGQRRRRWCVEGLRRLGPRWRRRLLVVRLGHA
ncbi:hypothetical protein [Streptomyces sp. ADI98-10]|uniref:hypothetical protein n=1 Tax=Streptomyces sp. ADI98-10 TaxID=1522763 RepID=UPI001F1498B6|nr:hypothetical protein [Streptomyces sp. ADI98-10]